MRILSVASAVYPLIKTGGRYASLHRLQAGIHEVR